MKLVGLLLLFTACISGTDKPGVRRCTTWFFVIGYTRSCEEGPKWTDAKTADDAPDDIVEARRARRDEAKKRRAAELEAERQRAEDARREAELEELRRSQERARRDADRSRREDFWCTTPAHGPTRCMRRRNDCEVFASSNPGFEPCESRNGAICAGDACFIEREACVAAERATGRDGTACAER